MNMKLKIGAFHLILNINRKKYSASKYTDLAPVDNADKDGNYCQAIDYAINNDRIKNIALTGPYGSGKSSLIKTFEKNNAYKFLNISLASFKEELISQELHTDKNERENAENIRNTLIERSILQQMLYGASLNHP